MAELTAESTTEDIQEAVEKVVEEVKAEREPEQKSDAQITSETSKPVKPPVAEKSDEIAQKGEKPAKAAKAAKAEKAAKAVETSETWFDDDVKAEVAAYGIGEAELADFASREELDRALRLFDKSALEAGRKALAEGEPESTRNDKGQFVAKKEEEPPKVATEGGYQIGLSKDVYDDELVGEFTRMRDHYEERLKALESRLFEADARSEEQRFDSLVDSLDHSDLFGTTGKEDAEQLQRRQDLNVQVRALQNGLAQMGRQADLDESLVNRVARMVFAEDFGKKDLKTRTRKISRQSNARQGGGATRPQDPREDPRDEADRMYKELSQA